jgi:hypothetical protein
MKITMTLVLLIITAGLAFSQPSTTGREPGQLLVQLKSANSDQVMPLLVEHFSLSGLTVEKQLSRRMNIWLLKFDEPSTDASVLLEKLKQHPAVSLAQFNHLVQEREIIPNDPSFSTEWALKNTGQQSGTPGADIKATFAWDITTSGTTITGDTIVVAMIDAGIDLGHSDLKLWKNRLEIPFNNIDDDENGYIDDYNGWNAYSNNCFVTQSDHGTHVAGIATAKGNNSLGIAGVAFNTYLMPISGSGSNEAVAVVAYDYVFEMRKRYNETNGAAGAFVVVTNSSFGIDGGNPANYPLWGAIYDSLGSVGILNVASTANRAWDVDIQGDIPTAMTNESIVAITNSTNTDGLNTQAAWGLNSIDLAAPGTNIYSTRQGDTYGYKTGTSMSSPMVSGSIALMYAAAPQATLQQYAENPELVASKFKRYLIASVDTIPAMVGKSVSNGRLNLLNALLMVQNPPALYADPPEVSIVMEPNTSTTVTLQLTSLNTEQNPYTLTIPDTIQWVYAEVPGGLLLGSNPGTITLHFNTAGLSQGHYSTTMVVKDYFLNELTVYLEVKIEEGVNTRLLSPTQVKLTASPNPFTSETILSYSLSEASHTSLIAYDLNGRVVATIFEGFSNAGGHAVKWNSGLGSGVYLVKLVCGNDLKVMKVLKK